MSQNRVLLAVLAIALITIPAWGGESFAVVKSKLADIRSKPSENSARQTQALYGEVVAILQNNSDGWSEVSLYWQKHSNEGKPVPIVGWTRSSNITIPLGKTHDDFTRNTAILFNPSKSLWVPLYERTADGLRLIGSCPEGTLLPLTKKSESELTVLLPDGQEGVVSSSNVRMLSDHLSYADFSAALLFHAGKFIGLPVVPGGLGPRGIDGSGLVHLACRIAGRLIPRDEAGISDSLRPKDKAALVRGDIIMLQHAFSGQTGTALYSGPNEALGATSTNIGMFTLDDRTWLTTTGRGFLDSRAADPATNSIGLTNALPKTNTASELASASSNTVSTNTASPEDAEDMDTTAESESDAASSADKAFTIRKKEISLTNRESSSLTNSTEILIDRSAASLTNSSEILIDRSAASLTNTSEILIDRSVPSTAGNKQATANTNGASMYSIHLGSMLMSENAVRLLNAVKHTSLPVFVTVSETPKGQFLSLHAGWFPDAHSARQAHAANLLIKRVAPKAAVRPLARTTIPWSAGMRLYSVQLMSLKNPFIALDTMRDLARLGLGPVLRYIPLADGRFWSVIHCELGLDRAKTQQRVEELKRRTRWKPILAHVP